MKLRSRERGKFHPAPLGPRTSNPVLGRRTGFTFVEAIVAIMLLMVGAMPIVMLFTSTTSEISGTIDNVLMASYANELIDAVISTPYDQVPSSLKAEVGPLAIHPFLNAMAARLSKTDGVYRRRIEITTDTINFAPDVVAEMDEYTRARFEKLRTFKVVKVAVDFAPEAGRPKTLDIGTILTAE